uniref:Uncharacterized protein n=1 Tax=Oryza brachyantha TaxID=4533 RepID=J3MIY5_ORYBR
TLAQILPGDFAFNRAAAAAACLSSRRPRPPHPSVPHHKSPMEAAAAAGAGTGGGGGGGGGKDGAKQKAAACDVEALRKCLAENKGDRSKCQEHIDAFRSSCSAATPPPRRLTPS